MPKILQLKISLMGFKPLIWRRFLVDDSITFHELHEIIQEVMGWEDNHMFEFVIDNVHIEADKQEQEGFRVDAIWTAFRPRGRTLPSSRTRLDGFMKGEKLKFFYTYDFGDKWEHSILVEKIMEKGSQQKCPVCIAGKMACPPEDCGGIWGYEELLEIRKDKNHPDYEERIAEWLGEDFDPEMFDANHINESLKYAGARPGFAVVRPRKIGRNDPCPCGSGKKYKKCCLRKMEG